MTKNNNIPHNDISKNEVDNLSKSENSPKEEESSKDEISKEEVIEDLWLIRDCDLYKDEYSECTGLRGRMHQYFVYGEMIDCKQWKKDFNNCCKWTGDNDVKAAQALIESEKDRRLARFRAHYANNIWKKRDKPPEDWNKPLPEWITKRDENTYLAVKAKEIKGELTIEEKASLCTIM